MEHEKIFEIPITLKTKEHCILEIVSWIIDNKRGKHFVCVNPHSIEVAREDSVFSQALKNADLVVPDGIGIVIASKLLRGKIRKRITGSDIFYGVNEYLNKFGKYTCFFLGSTEEVLFRIKNRMEIDYPNIQVVGTYSPPFKDVFESKDNLDIINHINRVNPDILWVGMTAPKQEKWVFQNKDKLNVKFIGSIGAVFDFYAGTKKRSGKLFQMLGLEWLPRLIREPKRLWQRVFISTPKFFCRVLKERLQL